MTADDIAREIQESIRAKQALLDACVPTIGQIVEAMIGALRTGGTIYLMGCGGSAADAQHIAGELIGRFKMERPGLACVALTTDTSVLTSIGNDYGFDQVFVRQVEGLVKSRDVVVGISTSGNTEAVLSALQVAKDKGARTVGLTGQSGGALKELADICLCVPSSDTPRIQECHITVGHILCGLVERGGVTRDA